MVLVEQKLAIQTKSKYVDDKTYFKKISNIFDRAEIIKSNQILWIKKAYFKLKISLLVMTRIYQIKFNCQTNTHFFQIFFGL